MTTDELQALRRDVKQHGLVRGSTLIEIIDELLGYRTTDAELAARCGRLRDALAELRRAHHDADQNSRPALSPHDVIIPGDYWQALCDAVAKCTSPA